MLQIQVLIKRSVLIVALIVGKVGLAQIAEVEGNVGVGTLSPKEKLHIRGNLLLDAFDRGIENGIFFRENFSAANKYNQSIFSYDHNNGGTTPDGLSINAFDGISFSTGANYRREKMRITQFGDVGIATINPSAKLDVNGTTKMKKLIVGDREDNLPDFINAWYGRNGFTGISLSDLSQPASEKMWTMSSSGGDFTLYTQTDNYEDAKWAFRIERSTGLDIDKVLFPEGNIGIGTNNPNAKLDVNGSSKFSGDITIEGMLNSKIAIKEYANQEFYNFGGTKTVKIEGDIDGGGRIGIQSGNNASDFSSVYLYADGAAESQGIIVKKFKIDNSSAIGAALLSSRFDGDTEAITGLELNTTNSVVVVGDKIDYEKNKGYGLINKFKTKFENDLYLNSGKRVGIGTTAPKSLLDINANTNGDAVLRLEADTNNSNEGNNPRIEMYQDGGTHGAFIGFNQDWQGDYQPDNMFRIVPRSQGNNINDAFVINPFNGNVGIGVSNPIYQLHTTKGVVFRKTALSTVVGSASNGWMRDSWLTGSYGAPKWDEAAAKWIRPGGTYNDVGGIIFQDEGTYFLREKNGSKLEYTNSEFLSTAYMFANMAGNIGIGTNTPDSKLTVAGKVHAQEVKVTVNAGADFVFADDYELPNLEILEQFVKTNKHLPEIASEKEMQQDGLLLAEMNIKLLQKIEELTLYTIEQDKQIKQLQEQKAINAVLESRLAKLEQALLKQE